MKAVEAAAADGGWLVRVEPAEGGYRATLYDSHARVEPLYTWGETEAELRDRVHAMGSVAEYLTEEAGMGAWKELFMELGDSGRALAADLGIPYSDLVGAAEATRQVEQATQPKTKEVKMKKSILNKAKKVAVEFSTEESFTLAWRDGGYDRTRRIEASNLEEAKKIAIKMRSDLSKAAQPTARVHRSKARVLRDLATLVQAVAEGKQVTCSTKDASYLVVAVSNTEGRVERERKTFPEALAMALRARQWLAAKGESPAFIDSVAIFAQEA